MQTANEKVLADLRRAQHAAALAAIRALLAAKGKAMQSSIDIARLHCRIAPPTVHLRQQCFDPQRAAHIARTLGYRRVGLLPKPRDRSAATARECVGAVRRVLYRCGMRCIGANALNGCMRCTVLVRHAPFRGIRTKNGASITKFERMRSIILIRSSSLFRNQISDEF